MEKNINITERLKKCGAMVEKGSKIADVGTDHAYLPIYLIKEKKATHAIACDLREGPLENAKKNIKKFGLEEKIETRLSNGLENIKENEADEVIIAGMGGILISEILAIICSASTKKVTKHFFLVLHWHFYWTTTIVQVVNPVFKMMFISSFMMHPGSRPTIFFLTSIYWARSTLIIFNAFPKFCRGKLR